MVLVVLFYTISTFWPTLFLFKSQFQPESLCRYITNPALLRCSFKPASPNNTLFYGSSLILSPHKNSCVLSTALKSDSETWFDDLICMNAMDVDSIVYLPPGNILLVTCLIYITLIIIQKIYDNTWYGIFAIRLTF